MQWNTMIILILRSLACIFLPIIVAILFNDSCGRLWVQYWKLCNNKDLNQVIISYETSVYKALYANYYTVHTWLSVTTPLMYWRDICETGFEGEFQYGMFLYWFILK